MVSLKLGSNNLPRLLSSSFPSTIYSLKRLNLSDNRIDAIEDNSFKQLSELQDLYLSQNRLRELSANSFSGLLELKLLDLSNNFLEQVPTDAILKLKNLKKLKLGSNNIQTLEDIFGPGELMNLEYLDLSRNMITSLTAPCILTRFYSLKVINLAYNSIGKVSEIDENVFHHLTRLEVIDLSDNQLEVIPSAALYQLVNLKKLFLDYNKIDQITEDDLNCISKLDELSMTFNLLRSVPDIFSRKLPNLHLLNLHGNKIEVVSSDSLSSISDNLLGLDLGFNDLTDIPKLSFPKMMILNLAMNQLTSLGTDITVFDELASLRHLNISYNQIPELPIGIFENTKMLEVIHLQGNTIEKINAGVFTNSSFVKINLSLNQINELNKGAFEDLPKLKILDLSENQINSIKNGAFDNVLFLKVLTLSHNRLTTFKAEYFTSRTRLEELNLCHNQIFHLYLNSFSIHRRLKKLHLCHNRLAHFSSEILANLRSLNLLDLSYNKLTSLDSSDFANMPSLRELNLAGNEIKFIGSNVFHNSTQLYKINLSHNLIHSLDKTTFMGLARLNLDLSYNWLTTLLPDLFNRQYVAMLESINLSGNQLTRLPSEALKKQYLSLESADFSRNKIQHLSTNSDLLVNLKHIDLSYNPLTPEAHAILFGEPKSVRKLDVTSTNIFSLPASIETPFLVSLNLSNNNLSELRSSNFEKANLLQSLDLSGNKLTNLNHNIGELWTQMTKLKQLYLSRNPIQHLMKKDLEPLTNLQVLDLSHLHQLTHFECDLLSSLSNLKVLLLYDYPSLNYLGIQDCLIHLNTKLQKLGVEIKENHLHGHLQGTFSPQIDEVIITGEKLTTLSSNSLLGIKSPKLVITLADTSVNNIPYNLFSTLPLSTKVDFNIQDNEITNLNYQLLNKLDSKQMNVKLIGLEMNPIICDCYLQPLWKWSHEKMKYTLNAKYYNNIDSLDNLTCSGPEHLRGHRLKDLDFDELTCSEFTEKPIISTSTQAPSSSSSSAPKRSTGYRFKKHPNIIFEASTRRPYYNKNILKTKSMDKGTTLTKVDTMIIGIAAGVIAFIVILVLIMCIIRLRTSSNHYFSTPLTGSLTIPTQLGCTCLKPVPNSCSSCYARPSPSATAFSHNGTLRPTALGVSYCNTALRSTPVKIATGGTMGRYVAKKSKSSGYCVTYPELESNSHKL